MLRVTKADLNLSDAYDNKRMQATYNTTRT